MKITKRPKINVLLSIFLTALLLTFAFFTTYGIGQKEEREITKINSRNEPIKVKSVKNRKGKIDFNKKFDGENDWFEGLSFNIENTSAKGIKFIEIELSFTENQGNPPLSYPMMYGTMPPSAPNSLLPDSTAIIQPGETAEVTLGDIKYSRLKTALQMENYPASIKKIQVRVETVIFDDDTMWRVGQIMKRDPNDPNTWIPLNSSVSQNSDNIKFQKAAHGGKEKKSSEHKNNPRRLSIRS